MTPSEDPRYPCTYCADYIRSLLTPGQISRGDSNHVLRKICEVLEVDESEAQRKIADHYLKNEETINKQIVDKLLKDITGIA